MSRHALVVHESCFGCTRAVAERIAEGLRRVPGVTAEAVPVARAPDRLVDVDLLVVGAPTHLLGLSSRVSRWLQGQWWGAPGGRRRARRPYGRPLDDVSVRGWLARTHGARAAAAFDTRMQGALKGGAAPAIARRLVRHGAPADLPRASFRVLGVAGPPAPGELERAAVWGAELGRRLTGTG